MNRTARAAALALGAAPCLSMPASAQDAAAEEIALPPITVEAAQRRARALLDTPVAASVMQGEALRSRQADTFQELIGDLPGLQIDGGPRGMAQEPNIRGFQDDQIVLRFDGGRFNFNQAHRGRFFIDPAIVDRVEVIRGGGSTLFGSGAMGGVISVSTKNAHDLLEPDETFGGRLHAGYSSNGNMLKLGATAFAQAGDFDWIGFAGWRPMFSDVKDGGGASIRSSEVDVENGLLKFGWTPTEADRIEAGYSIYKDHGTVPAAANTLGDDATDVDRDATVQTARLGWTHAGGPLVDLSATAYWNGLKIEEDRPSDGRVDTTIYDTYGLELTNRSSLDLGLPLTLVYGVEGLVDTQEGTRDGTARAQFPDATATTLSAFAEGTLAATGWLEITPGLRIDRYSRDPDGAGLETVEETFLSPRLGLSIRPAAGVQLWGNLARAFRAPSLTELYNDGAHFEIAGFGLGPGVNFSGVNRFVPNPDLEPEETVQVEIGARFEEKSLMTPGDRLTFSASAYYADAKNFIDQTVTFIDFSTYDPVTGTVDGTTTTENVDAKLWGAELEARYDAQDWYVGLGVTIPRGERKDGGALGSIPQDRAVVTAGWRPDLDWELGARATFAAPKDDVPDGSVPAEAWTKVDVFASWIPVSGPLEGIEMRAGVDNVFDAEYLVYPNGVNQAGRSYKISAAWRF